MVPSSLCEDPIGTWGAFCAQTFKKVIVEPSSLCEELIASWMHFVGGVPGGPGGLRELSGGDLGVQDSKGNRGERNTTKNKRTIIYIKKSKLPINRFSGAILLYHVISYNII